MMDQKPESQPWAPENQKPTSTQEQADDPSSSNSKPPSVNNPQQLNIPDGPTGSSLNTPVSTSRPMSTNLEPLAELPTLPPTEGLNPEKPKKHILITVLVVLAVLGIASAAALLLFSKDDNEEPARVKVGVMMAFSGGSSSMGYGANKGIQLAKKQLGANNIEIVQADSKCDPKSAAEAIKKLISQKVVAIIGEGCSSASVAALPAANNSKTVMISPSASSPTLTIPDDYFFRVVPSDTLQGAYMAQAIYDRGLRNVAVFYTNEPYGSGMNKVFQEKFEALGGTVVATANGEPDVIDLQTQMKMLKDKNPQALFIAPNSVVSATAVLNLARQAGITAPMFGADIMYDKTIITNAPAAAEGLTISSFPTGTKAFKQALLNEYQVTEQLYAAPQAYDAFHAIHMAVQKGAKTGQEIKQILPTLTFDGVSGKIKFDQNGEISDPSYKYDLFQVKGGTFIELE